MGVLVPFAASIGEAFDQDQRDSNGDPCVGDVERGVRPAIVVVESHEVDDVAKADPIDEISDRPGDDERNADREERATATRHEHPEKQDDGARRGDVKDALAHQARHVPHESKGGTTVLGISKLEESIDEHYGRALGPLRLGSPGRVGLTDRFRPSW